MNFYLFFRKLHLYLTFIALIPLSVVVVTGLLLLFEAEITHWQAEESQVNNPELEFGAEQRVQIQNHIKQLTLENRPCRVSYIRHDLQTLSLPWIYLTCPSGSQTFVINLNTDRHYPLQREGFRLITDLHRTLLLNRLTIDGESFNTEGRTLVGICSVILLLNIVLGLIMWFIRAKKVKLNKQQFKLKTVKGFSLRQLHAVTALYITPILLIIIITGISWTWREDVYSGLLYLQNKEEVSPKLHSQRMPPRYPMASLAKVYQKIEQDYPSYHVQGLAPALRRSDVVSIRLVDTTSLSYTPQLHVSLDAYSLKEKYKVDSWSADSKDSIHAYKTMQYGLHTGFAFGELGKWLWAIANSILLISVMSFGIILWLRRRKKIAQRKDRIEHVLTKGKA